MTGAVLADADTCAQICAPLCSWASPLGARVMVAAADSLATRASKDPRIESMHLLGAAVGTRRDWHFIEPAVAGTIRNYYSTNDKVLRSLYRIAEGGTKAIGCEGIPTTSRKVKNVNVSRVVRAHHDHLKAARFADGEIAGRSTCTRCPLVPGRPRVPLGGAITRARNHDTPLLRTSTDRVIATAPCRTRRAVDSHRVDGRLPDHCVVRHQAERRTVPHDIEWGHRLVTRLEPNRRYSTARGGMNGARKQSVTCTNSDKKRRRLTRRIRPLDGSNPRSRTTLTRT